MKDLIRKIRSSLEMNQMEFAEGLNVTFATVNRWENGRALPNKLAQTMMSIGKNVGRKMTAVISDMSQPLGYAVGNILEVKEAIDTLKGHGPEELTELS